MNLPNKLSTLRICLVPIIILMMIPLPYLSRDVGWNGFIGTYGMLIALILFIVASITDFIDGNIARSQNLITNLGKFLDPIADKLLVMSVLIALTQLNRVNAFIPVIISFRDLIVNGVRMLSASGGVVVAANQIGKWKTASQMVGIILIMLQMALIPLSGQGTATDVIGIVGDVLLGISVVLAIISVIQYVKANAAALKE